MSVTKCITWNVKGINNVVKIRKILSSLKKEAAQIAFIQETHLSDLEHVKLRRDWVGQFSILPLIPKVGGWRSCCIKGCLLLLKNA